MAGEVSVAKIKEALMRVMDELSPERRMELLEFALFLKARQLQQPVQLELELEKLMSSLPGDISQTPNPLEGSVIRYDGPFDPVDTVPHKSG